MEKGKSDPAAGRRLVPKTVIPRRARSRDVAPPKPEDAPVMRITWFDFFFRAFSPQQRR
jgi:hypothetical protein